MAYYIECEAVRNELYDADAITMKGVAILNNFPSADVVEVVHSLWILNDDGSGTCKHCNRTTKSCWDFDNQMHYCPNCGAKMDLEESNNDD